MKHSRPITMTIISLFLAVIHFASLSLHAEANFIWSMRAGGKGHDKIRKLAPTDDGGVFITGEFSDEADIGEHQLTSAGQMDFVVAKIDKDGRVLWASRAGGAKIERGYGVAPSCDGGCFVTGHFESESIRFGETILKNAGGYDGFLARYDANGECLWAESFGGPGYDFGHGIATTSDGNIILAGTITKQGKMMGESLGTGRGVVAILTKFTPAGKLIWKRTINAASISGHNVGVGNSGAIYLCGYARGKVKWSESISTESRIQDVYVAKYNSKGMLQWVQTAGGESQGLATSVAEDEKTGNVMIAGMFQAKARFGKAVFESRGKHDLFIALLSPGGEYLNAHRGGGSERDYALNGIALSGGGFAVTGEIRRPGEFKDIKIDGDKGTVSYIALVNGNNGKVDSFKTVGKVGSTLSYAITETSDSALVISGAFNRVTQLGDSKLISKNNKNGQFGNDIFVAKLKRGWPSHFSDWVPSGTR